MIANKIIDGAKRMKNPTLLFKVDFEKAYDMVWWSFLYYVMNFNNRLIKWIRCYVESMSMSVLANVSSMEEFKGERGLSQGDPLTPFLFIMVSEGLGGLMKEAVKKELFEGVHFGEMNFSIFILQFEDDTLFVGKSI